jgi:hypothetical protein
VAALQQEYGWQLSLATLVYRLGGLYRDPRGAGVDIDAMKAA